MDTLTLPVELIYMIYKLSNEQTQRAFKQTCRAFAVEPIKLPPEPLKVKEKVFITEEITLGSSDFNKPGISFKGYFFSFSEGNSDDWYDLLCIRGLKIDKEKETKEPVMKNRHDYILEFCKYTAVVSAVCKKCGKIELPMIRKCVINPV